MQLPVARAFRDKALKDHLSSELYVTVEMIDDDVEFAILASDGTWHVSLLVSFLCSLIYSPCTHVFCCNLLIFQIREAVSEKVIMFFIKITCHDYTSPFSLPYSWGSKGK